MFDTLKLKSMMKKTIKENVNPQSKNKKSGKVCSLLLMNCTINMYHS